jgi:hypothetical protein
MRNILRETAPGFPCGWRSEGDRDPREVTLSFHLPPHANQTNRLHETHLRVNNKPKNKNYQRGSTHLVSITHTQNTQQNNTQYETPDLCQSKTDLTNIKTQKT